MAKRKQTPRKGAKRPYRVSDKVRAANKINGRKGKNKKSFEGLKASSMNALKHARYAETDVLPGEDASAYQERLDFWPEELGAGTHLERYISGQVARLSWQWDRAQRANRDFLHGRMLATERKNRRDREQLVGALADEIAARPQEIIPELLQTAAGCVYIQDQFERLALGLEKANTWYITEWEWAVRLCSCRPCDFLFDRLCQSWTLFYLGAIRYPDGGRIDLQRAHEALDRHRPQTISIYEFNQQLKWFIALVPDKEKAVAGLKSLVADMIAGLQRRRTMLLAEQTEAQQLDVGAAACDPTLEGRRRSQHEESRFRAFAKMVDLCIKVKKARIAGVFDEPVQIDGFVKRPTPPAAASDAPAGEPEAAAASEAPVEKLDAGAMIAEWLDVTGPPLSYPGAAPEPAAPAPLDEPAPGSGGADSGVENQADFEFQERSGIRSAS